MNDNGSKKNETQRSDEKDRDIERFIDDLRHNSERRSFASFDTDTADQIADELEALIE